MSDVTKTDALLDDHLSVTPPTLACSHTPDRIAFHPLWQGRSGFGYGLV